MLAKSSPAELNAERANMLIPSKICLLGGPATILYVFESSSRQKNLYERMQLIRARDLLADGSAYHCDHRGVARRSGLAL